MVDTSLFKNLVTNRRNVLIGPIISATFCTIYSNYYTSRQRMPIVSHTYRMNLSLTRNYTSEDIFERWIVLTSVNPPTESVKYLAKLPGWRVVVVGDVKSPANWDFSNCDFLSVDSQKGLNFKVTSSLPYKSYARKNIGFLYAISHGAKFIYETDDDNRPIANLDGFIYTKETSGLMFAGKHLFNPYHHFGQSTLWPRGYPLSNIGDVTIRNYWISSDCTTPTVQQGIVNGDPDMDAIFRLTRKSVTEPINVTFDPHSPPVILPQGVFSPFNSQNTLFHERAFWALLIPTGTTFRMCDIWRGYWAKRLMWEIGDRLAFFPANAYQNRSPHSYLDDAKDEKDMYFQTESLISFLTNWTCPARLSFFDCVLKLTTAMADQKFWRQEEIELTRLWLEDLLELGYTEPSRVAALKLLEDKTPAGEQFYESNFNMITETKSRTKLVYVPAEQEVQMIHKAKVMTSIQQEAMYSISEICPNITSRKCTFFRTLLSNYYNDILVIIVFNFPGHYTNVYYLDALYSKVFPNLIYCGDNITNFIEATKSLGKQFSFIEAGLEKGEVGYLCAIKAMEMNLRVKGYLILGDDVMFKHWAFENSSKDHFWVTESLTQVNVTLKSHSWYWWQFPIGKTAFDKAMSDIETSRMVPEYINTTYFLHNLWNYTGSSDSIEIALADVYYIPARRQRETLWYLKKFYQNRSFLEVAVPTVVRGLEKRPDLVLIKGQSLWNEDRKNPFRIYSSVEHFFHPMKISDRQTFQRICEIFAPDILTKYFRLTP